MHIYGASSLMQFLMSACRVAYIVASELNDPICHSNECQIGSFSSEATTCLSDYYQVEESTLMITELNMNYKKILNFFNSIKCRNCITKCKIKKQLSTDKHVARFSWEHTAEFLLKRSFISENNHTGERIRTVTYFGSEFICMHHCFTTNFYFILIHSIWLEKRTKTIGRR